MSELERAIDEIFGIYDTDNSGELDTDEGAKFVRDLFSRMGKEISPQGEKYALNMMDQNGDGKISKDELIVIMAQAQGM